MKHKWKEDRGAASSSGLQACDICEHCKALRVRVRANTAHRFEVSYYRAGPHTRITKRLPPCNKGA